MRAIFLDRDGVINKKINGYVKEKKEFNILPNVRRALILFKHMGYKIIIITNQQGIGKGIMTEEDLKKIHDYMLKKLPEIDDIFYCPDLEGGKCRKPNPYMILKAAEKHNINLKESFMIGDEKKDIIAGKKAGCKTIGIGVKGDYKVSSLYDAAIIIKYLNINSKKLL